MGNLRNHKAYRAVSSLLRNCKMLTHSLLFYKLEGLVNSICAFIYIDIWQNPIRQIGDYYE